MERILSLSKASPYRAPIPFFVYQPPPKNSAKPAFSLPVENTPEFRVICQNAAKITLIEWPLMAFKPPQFLPCILPSPGPKTLPEREYEGYFPGKILKKEDIMPIQNNNSDGSFHLSVDIIVSLTDSTPLWDISFGPLSWLPSR
jgi:hypothetical protein